VLTEGLAPAFVVGGIALDFIFRHHGFQSKLPVITILLCCFIMPQIKKHSTDCATPWSCAALVLCLHHRD
jgi:hypothetical protein